MALVTVRLKLTDCSLEERLEGEDKAKIAALLLKASETAEAKSFGYAPLKEKELRAAVPRVKSWEELSKLLAATKPSSFETKLRGFVTLAAPEATEKRGDPMELAVACYFNELLQQLYPYKLSVGKASGQDVLFAADVGLWRVVKKAGPQALPKEVLAVLVGIRTTAERKALEFASTDYAGYKTAVDALSKKYPVRKSFGALQQFFANENKQAIAQSVAPFFPAEYRQLAEKHAVYSVMQQLGFSPRMCPDHINSVFPELKIPKPKGRVAKA